MFGTLTHVLDAQEQLAQLQQDNAGLAARVDLLKEENRWLKAQLFGRSSEKRAMDEVSPDQARLMFNEAESIAHSAAASSAPESVKIPAQTRKKKPGRKALPQELPRVELIHDLPEQDKRCARDGSVLEVIGREESEQLDYVPAKLQVIRHIRLKYACPCCKQGVKLAPVPVQLFPKSNATAALIAHIATAKYVDGTPLYRQEAQVARLGVELPRATQARWMIQAGEHVVPLINLMHEQMLTDSLIHMDETTVQVLKSDKAPSADHWMWVRASGPPGKRLVLYDYDASRSGAIPKRLLEGFGGVLLTDGYEAYSAAVAAHSLTHAGCWAHVRRKFEEARKVQAQSDSRARVALDYIGQLYGTERHLRERAEPLSDEQRLQIRGTHCTPLLAELQRWLTAMSAEVLPQSALGKAIAYTLSQWPKLTVFVDYPAVPLDNNRCENVIRPFVIGRKNWLFSDTQAGARASANLYSLIETAKANGIEPHAYLTWLFTHLPYATALEHFEAMLPWNVKAELASR